MKYEREVRVLYADTDSYGVVWHGAYTKWFEEGRVGIVEMLGLELEKLEQEHILFPVVEMNVRYKSSAKMNERIIIETEISEVSPLCVTFEHRVTEKTTGTLRTLAKTSIVAINSETGKLYRKMPDFIYSKFLSAKESNND